MRGPKVVGYPPAGLRWAGDSSRLYFEWRRPETTNRPPGSSRATAARRASCRTTNAAAAPPVAGRWDAARRRVLFVDSGDIVMLDSVAGTRRQITRTTGPRANPRWARRESRGDLHARQQPVPRAARRRRADAADRRRSRASASRARPRARSSSRPRSRSCSSYTRIEAEKKKQGRGEGEGARAAEASSWPIARRRPTCSSRPTAATSSSSSSSAPENAKRPNVPNYVTESGYTEDIPVRTFVGDAQDKRSLSVLNLNTGRTCRRSSRASIDPAASPKPLEGDGAA